MRDNQKRDAGKSAVGHFSSAPFRHKKRLVVELECRAGIPLSNEMKFRIGLNAFHHLSNACPRHLFIFLFTPKGKRERYSKVQTSLYEIRLFRAIYWTIPSDCLQRHKHRHGLPAQNHPRPAPSHGNGCASIHIRRRNQSTA